MNTNQKVIGIVGSYRKNGIIDSAITEILEGAATAGAETKKIYLQDLNINFCTNCRICMAEPGLERGKCILADDMDLILQEIESANSLAIGAPVNFGNINALTQRFLERCVCYGYWPSDAATPQIRNPKIQKKSVLVSSSAAPGWMGRLLTGAMGSLKYLSKMLGAKPIGVIWIGLIKPKDIQLPDKIKQKAKQLGQKLAV
ncbi:MAG TPA: NAD(P)H dehydrogenase [Cyanobacteria bacterium UBA11149]|nr:NAD(P)H dehydrogenase [Cyanobacteria bacterium UBA11367]HBE56978.1 NAD(P)H dehydrogenase [Cyanobacteria bacterium UBA11366]HBK64350.1 NAD(P)H dehydrogenase [Cyanobacteria bacterium UBA11166]HBR74375.1 NAD(P)H dehydrogenase [Cyanobacteria bacterium UBA11159]HBS70602.1 NAD(P)H dehydrogenase [Cyanobacteria bacterium UBA11153]HBW89079.1 NAD(P)H dehydrogenase [Cyanobacteria bacterium UBA11149]HCA95741.1 NAD(P)H dehydrogenase [Cyanobacteria bacterium UBA9226]